LQIPSFTIIQSNQQPQHYLMVLTHSVNQKLWWFLF